MPEVNINYGAVLVAALLNMAVGFLWYSRSVFGDTWMKLTGKKMDPADGANMGYALTMIGSLIAAYVLAYFIDYAQADTMMEGMVTGFWAWLGFVLPTMGANAIFEGKSYKLIAINVGFPLVSFLLMGWVIAVWV